MPESKPWRSDFRNGWKNSLDAMQKSAETQMKAWMAVMSITTIFDAILCVSNAVNGHMTIAIILAAAGLMTGYSAFGAWTKLKFIKQHFESMRSSGLDNFPRF